MSAQATTLAREAFTLAPALFLGAACGETRDGAQSGTVSDPTGTGGDRGNSASTGGLATGGAGVESSSGGRAGSGGNPGLGGIDPTGGTPSTGGGSTGGAPETGGTSDAGSAVDAAPPVEIRSKQTITFHLTNTSGAVRYVVTDGNYCTALDILSLTAGEMRHLSLELGMACPCECPTSGEIVPTEFYAMNAGDKFDIVWDARALVTHLESVPCSGQGPPFTGTETVGVLQPIDPGRYRMTVGVVPAIPQNCTPYQGQSYQCPVNYPGGGSPGVASICLTSDTATADFTLPATGNVDVPVDVH